MDIRAEAKQNRDQFIERVNAEFGGKEEWETRKNDISQQTGADNVYVQRDVMATKLCQEGFIYSPHIGRCRFTVKLRPQDVGLDPDNDTHKEFIAQYLSLGNKFLLPAELLRRLDRLDQKIRRMIGEEYGIPTVAGSFVPLKNVELMKEKFDQLKAEYFAIRDEILDEYFSIKFATETAYKEYALEAYRLIRKNPYYVPSDEEVDVFVKSTMAHFPSKEEIYASFYVTLDVGAIETTEFLASQESRLSLIKERELRYYKELNLIERKLTEESRVQNEHEKNRLLIEREQLKTALMEEQGKQKAIEEAIAIKREEYLPRMEEIFADLAGAVHGVVFDTLNKVTETLKKNGELKRGDTVSLKNLMGKVRNLTVSPDPELERWMKKIQEIVDTPAQKRDADEVRETIHALRSEAGKVILSIGRVPRTLRGMDISDVEMIVSEEVPVASKRQTRIFGEDYGADDTQENVSAAITRMQRPRPMDCMAAS